VAECCDVCNVNFLFGLATQKNTLIPKEELDVCLRPQYRRNNVRVEIAFPLPMINFL